MASFYSKPADYGTYTQAINLDLVNFVMGSKQQKYDYNLDKIQTKIKDELGGLDLERAQDKEYFLERAQTVLESAGDLSKVDWSKNGVTRNIDAQLNSVIDDRVIDNVISTRNYRSFQNNLSAKQKKNDGSYDPTNAAYAMTQYGVNDWLNGDKENVGSIQYQDYTDVGAELKDISENLDKYVRVFKRQLPSGDGKYWVTEEGEQLTASEVRRIAESQLTNKAKSQMQINGWANYDAGVRSTSDILSDFNTFKENKLKSTDTIINNIQTQLKNLQGTNSPDIDKYNAQLESYREYRASTNDMYDSWIQKESVSNITTTMENERVLDQFGNAFAINNMESTIDANPYILADYKARLDRETNAEKIAMQAQAKSKEDAKIEKSQYQFVTPTLDRDGNAYTTVNRYKETISDIANLQDTYKQTVKSVYAEIKDKDPDVAASLKEGYDPNSGISEEAYIEHKMQQMGSPSANYITATHLKSLESARLRRDNAIKIKTDAEDSAFDLLESSGGKFGGLENIVEEYRDNRSIMVMGPDGTVSNAETLFDKYGIEDATDLNDNTEVKEALLKSYYADKINRQSQDPATRSGGDNKTFEVLPSAGGYAGMNTAPITIGAQSAEISESKKAELEMLRGRLVQKFGGDKEKAQAFLEEARNKKIGTGTGFMDVSVTQDNSLDAWITPEELESAAGNILAETGKSTRKDVVVVRGKTGMANDLANVVNSNLAKIDGGIKGEVSEGRGYTIEDIGDGTVNVFFQTSTKDGTLYDQKAVIPLVNLPESISNAINFKEQKPIFTRQTMKEISSPVKLIDETDQKSIKSVAGALNIDKRVAADMVTKEGLEKSMFRAFPQIVGSKKEPTPEGQALMRMVRSKDLVSKIENIDGDFMFKVYHKNPTTGVEKAIYSPGYEIPESDLETAYFNVKFAPQFLISEMVRNTLTRTQEAGEGNVDAALEKIMNIYGQ